MSTVAYRRVSTTAKKTDRQLPDEKFDKEYENKASAKDLDRPKLNEMIEYVREGDTVVVDSIDRLARNLADLESLIQTLNEKGVAVKFRKEQLKFSGGSDAIQTLTLQMMGALARFGRSMTRERQREGKVAAKTAGKHMAKPSVDLKCMWFPVIAKT